MNIYNDKELFGDFGDTKVVGMIRAFEEALRQKGNKHLCMLVEIDEEDCPIIFISIASWSNAIKISDETADRLKGIAIATSGDFYRVERITDDFVVIKRGEF